MRDDGNKLMEELENKVLFLENKLTNILKTIELINSGGLDKAKISLNNYKGSTANIVFTTLVDQLLEREAAQSIPAEKNFTFLKVILNSLPYPVFVKDENFKYLLINKLEENLFGIKESEIVGKHDSDFVHDEDEMKVIQKSDSEVLSKNKSMELPNQSFSVRGKSYIFKTYKIPFVNPHTGKTNILGFSLDVTDTVNLDKLKKILMINSPYL